MKPIRVLQVVTIMNRGGLETMLMNYYRAIDRDQIQFDFMVHRTERGHYDDEIEELGGRIFRMLPIRPGTYSSYFKQLDDFFQKNKEYKIVHSHINENSSFVLRAAKRANVPIRIAHSHLSDLKIDLKLPFRMYARAYLKGSTNQFFACSKRAGKWLFGNNVNDKEIIVLNNAVNVKDFHYNSDTRYALRERLGVGDNLVIGHVGRFNKQKNHEFVIDIFKKVHDTHPNAILLLIGDGHLKEQIIEKVHKQGLSANVKFLGVREDISQLMQAMDLFLFPSLFEGLPVVLIEAQAAGLNCVVSDSITREVGITDRIQFISLNKSAETWAEKILSTPLEHTDTIEQLKRNGFDTSTSVQWLTSHYQNSLTGGV